MTTFINARFLCQPLSGVQRFATEILNALDRQLESDPALSATVGPIIALHPAGILRHPNWRNITVKQVGRTHGHIWEQGALYHASKRSVLVSLGNAGPLRHSNQILALHDANIWEIPSAFSSKYKVLHKTMRPILAKRARRLLTVSQFSANALSTHLNVLPNKFSIIPNGADHIMRVTSDHRFLQETELHQKNFLLSVGNLSPNKNIERLIQAHSLAGSMVPPLVIVGGKTAGVEEQKLTSGAVVQFLGRVSDSALRALYEQAAGFVFPSLYEGFGIPPLEAMQLGTPVLASERAAMPEVLQDGAMFFDPTNVDRMAGVLQEFSTLSDVVRTNLVSRGKSAASRFTWEKSARLLVEQILTLNGSATIDERDAHTKYETPARIAS